MTRARQILLFLGACTFAAACGGDDDGDGIIVADSGPTVDSAPDASVGCGDYEEAADGTNDALVGGTAEASGITFASGDTKVVCGVIDPAHMDAEVGVIDIDGFDLDTAGAPMRMVLRTDGADQTGGVLVLVQQVFEDGVLTVGGGGYVDGYLLVNSYVYEPGDFRISVIAFAGEELPTAPISYEIEIVEPTPCVAAEGDPDYTEDRDGARSRRNDTVSVNWDADPAIKVTRSTTDNPEPTELTLDLDTPIHLRGTSGDVADNDSYHDKDAYAVTLGEGVTEIDVRMVWPDEGMIDMDSLAFVAENLEGEIGAGAFGGFVNDEVFTARVPAGADLWIWAGAYTGSEPLPVDYDLTICSRAFTP